MAIKGTITYTCDCCGAVETSIQPITVELYTQISIAPPYGWNYIKSPDGGLLMLCVLCKDAALEWKITKVTEGE